MDEVPQSIPLEGKPKKRTKNSKYITKLKKGVDLVEKTKEYERVKLDILYLKATDVISTSTPGQETDGDEDSFGWA